MSRQASFLLVGVLALAVFAADAESSVDWSNVTWTAGSLSNAYSVGDTLVTYTFSSVGSVITAGNPVINSDVSGFDDVLECRMDISATAEPPTQYVTLTVTFSKPVKQVSFTIADFDGGGVLSGESLPSWQDIVIVSAYNGGTEKTVSATSVGSAVLVDTDGNDYSTSDNLSLYAITGNVPSTGPGGTDGDVAISIPDWITSYTDFYYPVRNTGDAGADGLPYTGPFHAGAQFIRFSRTRFNPVPAGLALFGVGLLLAGVWRWRMRRRKSAA